MLIYFGCGISTSLSLMGVIVESVDGRDEVYLACSYAEIQHLPMRNSSDQHNLLSVTPGV